MAQDIRELFGVVVLIGSGSSVIILINKVLFFGFSLIDEKLFFPVNEKKNVLYKFDI